MSTDEQHGFWVRLTIVAMALLLVLAGAVAVVVALSAQVHAPQPPPSAAVAPPSAQALSGNAGLPAAPGPASAAQPKLADGTVPPSAAATPVHLKIPAIKISADLLGLGLNPDNTLQVPPLSKNSQAGWYRGSPTPGQLGPSVILGHADSAKYGPGIFFKLGALRPGDTVTVTRADHTAATFKVDRVVSYPKNHFPTLEVYGNTGDAELRLITCGGTFDSATGNYLNNIVVYASLLSSSTV